MQFQSVTAGVVFAVLSPITPFQISLARSGVILGSLALAAPSCDTAVSYWIGGGRKTYTITSMIMNDPSPSQGAVRSVWAAIFV